MTYLHQEVRRRTVVRRQRRGRRSLAPFAAAAAAALELECKGGPARLALGAARIDETRRDERKYGRLVLVLGALAPGPALALALALAPAPPLRLPPLRLILAQPQVGERSRVETGPLAHVQRNFEL